MKRFLFCTLALALLVTACAKPNPDADASGQAQGVPQSVQPAPEASQSKPADAPLRWEELRVTRSMELQYADQFAVDYCEGGFKRLTIADTGQFLIVPEGAAVPEGVPAEVTVLQQPLDAIYLAATSAMDLFRELNAIDRILFSSVDAGGWYIDEAREAIERGDMFYAGKYSAPDYEALLEGESDLAVESTMIYHNPEVKEQLERFGVPVLVERSSYEGHPLGRMEWIKLYAALLDLEETAGAFFNAQMEKLAPILGQPKTGKRVAFFYITSNGAVNVRKGGDYIAKSISLAGGDYVFSDLAGEEGNALSTMTIQLETFYDKAKDADVLVYNSSIDAELSTIDELLSKSGVLADFKAVQEGHVWCTGKNLFQESLGLGDFIEDLNRILTAEDPTDVNLTYLHRLT